MSTPTPIATTVYPAAFEHLTRGRYGDLIGADVRVMLATAAYTPADADTWATDVTAETAGAGYTAGGLALSNLSLAYDTATGHQVLSADPVTWPAASFIARHAVLYVNTGAGPALLAHADFGADLDPAGADVPLSFPDGIARFGPIPDA